MTIIDTVTITTSGHNYSVTLPGDILRASNLLNVQDPKVPLEQAELLIDQPTLFVAYDPEERTVTYHLPDEPEENPDRPLSSSPKPLTKGERAVLEGTEE
jgi:hypothetical protein